MSIVGICVQGVTLPFCCVTVCLGSIQTGCAGVMRLAGGHGACLGLTKGNRGLLDLLRHLFALGSMSEMGECLLFVLYAMSSVIRLAVCS